MKAEEYKKLIVNDRKIACMGDAKNGHPKVFLYIGRSNTIECPYCNKQIIYEKK